MKGERRYRVGKSRSRRRERRRRRVAIHRMKQYVKGRRERNKGQWNKESGEAVSEWSGVEWRVKKGRC